jgi:tetratricopeptide (TPR) repeat protein
MAFFNLHNKNVLIVDDIEEMQSMFRLMVVPLSPDKISLAKTGEEAIELMEKTNFDIVLCDYNLGGGKDGQQVLEEAKFRKLLPYSSMFIMVTAENTSEMIMGAIEFLPDDYLTKPFNQDLFESRLKKLSEKKSNLIEVSKALSNSNSTLAVQLCDKLLLNNTSNRLEVLKIKGEQLITLKEYDKAAILYEEILKERDIPWAYLALGRVCYFKKEYEEAILILKKLVEDNSYNVTAYDWLAKSYEAIGEMDNAKEMLNAALAKSPKSTIRQRSLAKVAYKINDLETAELAYKNAINVGQNSCFKSTDDYTNLAKALIDSDKADDAMEVANSIVNDFDGDTNSKLAAAITESMVSSHKGDADAANIKLEQALEIMKENPDTLSADAALELTDLCLANGKDNQAKEITQNIIRNNHEDEELLEKTKQIYSKANKADVGSELIEGVNKEIINTNNEGARLLKEGKLEESITLFRQAADSMPQNVIVNLNAAYSIIMFMNKNGHTKKHSMLASKYLERIRKVQPSNKKYHELIDTLNRLRSKAKAA